MKNRKMIVVLALAAIAALVICLAGCGSSSSSSSSAASSASSSTSSSSSSTSTAKTTTFAVGFDQEFPPYGYVGDDGNYTGFDLELAAEVAARNGWEIKYVPINWDAKDLELSSGSIDCIWNGFTIEGREDGYEWTDPYMNNTQVVVVRADSGINSLSDLAGKAVETQVDSSAFSLLSADGDQATLAATFKTLQTAADYNTAFMDLEQGAVDAVAIDQPVAEFQTAGKSQYKILDEALSTEHYGVGFEKGNTELRDTVESTLKEMDADGFVKTLCEKYADQGISYENWCLGKTETVK